MDNCNEIVKGDPLRVLRLLACTSNHIHLLFCDLKSANPSQKKPGPSFYFWRLSLHFQCLFSRLLDVSGELGHHLDSSHSDDS